MTPDQVEDVVRQLGCTKVNINNPKHVVSSCPFAKFTHEKGRDRRPSFYVKYNNDIENGEDGIPGYKCQTCGKKGSILNLIYELYLLTGDFEQDIYDFIKDCTSPSENTLLNKLKKVKSFYKGDKSEISIKEFKSNIKKLDEKILSLYFQDLPQNVYKYLKGSERKLTDETIAIWEISWHEDTGYIAIPIRDLQNNLVGVTGRLFETLEKKEKQEKYGYKIPKYLHSENMPCLEVLFGEHRIINNRRCYLVEGHFDVIFLWQCGYRNVLGVMGSELSEFNARKITQLFDEVIIISDNDKAGEKARKQWQLLLQDRVRVIIAKPMDGKDPNSSSLESIQNSLGENNNKKSLTTLFESCINKVSSLKSEDRKEVNMISCVRCTQLFSSLDKESEEFGNIEVNVSGKSVVEIDCKNICDCCIKDIERLIKQIKAIPEIKEQ